MSGTLRCRAEPQKINLFDESASRNRAILLSKALAGTISSVAAHHIDGRLMPLTRSKEQFLTTMNGVKFLMEDGPMEVPCRATRELLGDRFGSNGERDEDEKAFRLNRAAIEQAASDKYDAGEVESRVDPKIVVTAGDMASPLSRKM